MRKLVILASAIIFSTSNWAQAQMTVDGELSWCAQDWGHNEGASEAIEVLSRYTATIDPSTTAMVNAGIPLVGGVVSLFDPNADPAGEVLKRPPVMDAASLIVNINPADAVYLAVTCQAHNRESAGFLSSRREEVIAWLRTH